MFHFDYSAHTLVVGLQIVALLLLVALGLAVDALLRRKAAGGTSTLIARTGGLRVAPVTLAAWHRTPWRRTGLRTQSRW